MNENIIKVTPDKDGKLYIKLFGTTYQIVVEEKKVEAPKPQAPKK